MATNVSEADRKFPHIFQVFDVSASCDFLSVMAGEVPAIPIR
jgi:hypothetical protein